MWLLGPGSWMPSCGYRRREDIPMAEALKVHPPMASPAALVWYDGYVWIEDLKYPKRSYSFWGEFKSPLQGRSKKPR